jgi:hypothetical protein
MATDARKHTAPAAGETPRRQSLNDLSLSINDIIPVANTPERAQYIVDLTAAGFGPTAARPLYFNRADAGGGVERTTNGTDFTWITGPGLAWYSQRTADGSDISGVSSNHDWVPNAISVALPAGAPAGRYAIDGELVMYIDSATDTYIDRRIMWGTTEVEPASSGRGVAFKAAGGDAVRTFRLTMAHTGGAVTVRLDSRITAGGWRWRAATDMRVTWLGL